MLWQRAQGCCEHIDSKSKRRCSSKYALEIDHTKPVALAGESNIENLTLLCQAHNSRRSIKTFGVNSVST
ncbi:HNH endonuclease [Bdellovibrio sp. BCCA]|uniref:HNH endonuclease n=1 Tax=Bdellovibrio sp. BCCA TaxID=3136281 RepID=UPI00403FEA15